MTIILVYVHQLCQNHDIWENPDMFGKTIRETIRITKAFGAKRLYGFHLVVSHKPIPVVFVHDV